MPWVITCLPNWNLFINITNMALRNLASVVIHYETISITHTTERTFLDLELCRWLLVLEWRSANSQVIWGGVLLLSSEKINCTLLFTVFACIYTPFYCSFTFKSTKIDTKISRLFYFYKRNKNWSIKLRLFFVVCSY